jgi:chemotaxis protein histidine kinase CheA
MDIQTAQKLRKTMEGCIQLSRDKSTTQHERDAAKKKAEEIKEQLVGFNFSAYGFKVGDAEWKKLVAEGMKLTADIHERWWKLGELALQVDTKYGEESLDVYAKQISEEYGKLKDARTTVEAWPQKAARPAFLSVAQRLNPIQPMEARYAIVRKNPDITKVEAAEETRKYKAKKKADREAERAKAKAEKAKAKAKANGKDHKPEPKPEPEPEPEIRANVSKLAGIFDATCAKGGLEEKRAKELGKCNDDERKLVLGSLWELKDRVDRLIGKFTTKED